MYLKHLAVAAIATSLIFAPIVRADEGSGGGDNGGSSGPGSGGSGGSQTALHLFDDLNGNTVSDTYEEGSSDQYPTSVVDIVLPDTPEDPADTTTTLPADDGIDVGTTDS